MGITKRRAVLIAGRALHLGGVLGILCAMYFGGVWPTLSVVVPVYVATTLTAWVLRDDAPEWFDLVMEKRYARRVWVASIFVLGFLQTGYTVVKGDGIPATVVIAALSLAGMAVTCWDMRGRKNPQESAA
ncbi:hypothetical protein [Catenulispora pinisilvae]|uniref:hypothetical protein n=1 Tax=Catenulispora pinisilvae TaxID=2705253 RepID=UPI0018915452|nr:hypothetical protein [Catenulispora pinisilvae]